ncbi:hypothetical protein [Sciscionella marina]|uniref:hypothetical protein n=1 Tax=Sciscionella marina TaxID=508770 RepID=UPI0003767737|nr:hypothetical protein [Sciscionella marina]
MWAPALNRGEIAGFHHRRLDLEHDSIFVREVFDRALGEIKPPKGRQRRFLPVTDELATKLQT